MTKGLKFILTLLAASALLSWRAEAQVADYGEASGVLSFEESPAPATAGKGSAVSISDWHAKLGSHSLQWDWKRKGAFITIPGEIPYLPENPNPKETSVSTFVFWVYSPEVLKGELRFSFLKDGEECCHFTYKLGFKGWRGAWVAFDRDMTGTPVTGMNEVRITAPKEARKGTLYFDGIITSSFQDVRHHTPDWQAPFVNEKTTSHWLVLNNTWKLQLDMPLKDSLSKEELHDMQTVKARFVELTAGGKSGYGLKKAEEVLESYGITHNPDGTINGKPVYFVRYGETFLNLGIRDAKKTFGKNGQLLKELNDHMFRIAAGYLNSEDPEQKRRLAEIYVTLTRHLLDQGFAAGSGQGTLHHLGYSMRNFYTAPVIMQDVLKEAGLAEQVQQAMEWFSGVGEVKVAPKEPGMDIDAFNTSLMGRMASVLMLEDTPYKYAYMQALSRWVNNGLKYTEGLRPCFKRDGSVVHHRKSYPAYATGGFTGAVNAVWMLSHTGFAISQESHSNLKEALMAMKFYCYGDLFPLAMSGRHPDGNGMLDRNHYYRLALAGSPDGKDVIDTLMAGTYMALPDPKRYRNRDTFILAWQLLDKKSVFFADKGIKKAKSMNGTRTFGFNCSMSHRHNGRLVTIAGHSRYLWSAEIYQQANHYGRYLTHGSMQVTGPAGEGKGGYSQEGWDWCHIPGTTAAVLPMEKMKANVLNVDEKSGYEEMLLSDEWFAGGVTHRGQSGAFAMKLHEHDKYNGSLRARKSFFTFENRVICLGSDIENSLEGAPVHTTLLQHYTGGFEMSASYVSEDRKIIRDNNLDVYFVKDGNVRYSHELQHSLHEETDAPTEGIFEKAYIDHGDVITDGRYEYMVLMSNKDNYKMLLDTLAIKEYAKNLPYKVIRHDSSVHGVEDLPSGTRAYAVFGKDRVDSLVTDCSPAMLMYTTDGKTMTLSVSNPDLALYEGPSDEVYDENEKRKERSVYSRSWIDNPCGETTVTLTIDGVWAIADRNGCNVRADYRQGATTLTFRSTEARTEEIKLKKTRL